MFCFTPSEALKSLMLIALACFASFTFAAESGAGASSEYRLSVEKSAAFRAAAKEPAIPALEPRKETAIAARFADRPFAKLIDVAARDAALDPALVHAVISIESGYNPAARSPKGALGLMQVMPATAARYGVKDPGHSPAANLKAGTLYLSDLMQLFDSRIELVLAAYNAGKTQCCAMASASRPIAKRSNTCRRCWPVIASGGRSRCYPPWFRLRPASSTCLARVSTLITCKLRATAKD